MIEPNRYGYILDRTLVMVREWKQSHPEYQTWLHRQLEHRQLAAPFGFSEPPPLRWRVSADVRAELEVVFDGELAWKSPTFGHPEDTLYSIPLMVDDGLPPNSVMLVPT